MPFQLRRGNTGWVVVTAAIPVLYLVLASAAFPLADFRWMLVGGALIWLWAAAVPAKVLTENR